LFIETSAKAGFNIKALFRKVASALPGMENSELGKKEMVNISLNTDANKTITPVQSSSYCNC